MSAMKAICHIGEPQTQADLLQASFAQNPDWLAARGIAYGDVLSHNANHVTLYFACATKPPENAAHYGITSPDDQQGFRGRIAERLRAQQVALPPEVDRMVLSSDNLTGNMFEADAIMRLRQLLEPLFTDIKIVVYVRRQDDAILERYVDLVRRGISKDPFERFVDACLGKSNPMPHLEYRRELSKWVDVWGYDRVILRRYSPTDLIAGNGISDFMGIVQDTWEPDLADFAVAPLASPPLSAHALEFVRHLKLSPTIMKSCFPAGLGSFLDKQPQTPRPVMPAALSRRIMNHFDDANRWLKHSFYPALEGGFFPDRPDHPEFGNLGRLATEDAMAMIGDLLGSVDLEKA